MTEPQSAVSVPTPSELLTRVSEIGREIARPNADSVDRESLFPHETLSALKEARVLSAGLPTEFGGSGCNIMELSALVSELGQHCASASMVLAMHFIKVESFLYHGRREPQLRTYLRSIADEQRLVASVTSEVGVGGNLRHSIAAVEQDGDRFTLVKDSTCLSYGAEADDLLITCRRNSDSPPSDQVVVLATRGGFTLEKRGEWDAMGLRGTCSPPFLVSVEGEMWQVYKRPFGEIAARTMVPETHILWSSVWLGIAADATARARACIQARARSTPDAIPPAAYTLAALDARLQTMRSTLNDVTEEYYRAHRADDSEHLSTVAFGLRINNLKVISSELVAKIATEALHTIGFQGYLHQSPFCVARHIRDAHSAALMISNERIIDTNASLQLVHKG